MEWDRDVSLNLIYEYEKHPELWNSQHGSYYNKNRKHAAWLNIAQVMGCSPEEVKKKMESLLSSFRREKARGKKPVVPGGPEAYASKWFAFKSMSFLINKDDPKSASMEVEPTEEDMCKVSLEIKEEVNDSNLILFPMTAHSPSFSATSEPDMDSIPHFQKKMRLNGPDNFSHSDHFSRNESSFDRSDNLGHADNFDRFCPSEDIRSMCQSTTAEDDCEIFTKHLVSILKKLPEEDRLELQANIIQMATNKRLEIMRRK